MIQRKDKDCVAVEGRLVPRQAVTAGSIRHPNLLRCLHYAVQDGALQHGGSKLVIARYRKGTQLLKVSKVMSLDWASNCITDGPRSRLASRAMPLPQQIKGWGCPGLRKLCTC